MNFCKYKKIENSYRNKTINLVKNLGYNKDKWCVTEKVHGANTQITIEGAELKIGKRTSYLSEDDNFYNFNDVIKKQSLDSKLKRMYHYIISDPIYKTDNENVKLTLYGELFGGTYPHKDVIKSKERKIQTGVYYSPDEHFMAFDITINNIYIDYDRFKLLCDRFYIQRVPELFIGSFDDCMEYPNDKESIVFTYYDLPKLEDNIMEGVVIKPIINKMFNNGDRVIFKNKNNKFKEKEKVHKKTSNKTQLSKEENNVLNELLLYCTENRLKNVISHIGEVTNKDFGKLMGLMNKDILDDYLKDNDTLLKLEIPQQKLIKKALQKEVSNLIRENFLNIIDGEF